MPIAVFTLMIAIGMSIDRTRLVHHLKWGSRFVGSRLLLLTFVLPPLIALVIAYRFSLEWSSALGLFMVAVAPGAPLTTRRIAAKGYDVRLAASYQLWCAFLTPVMIPLIVLAAGTLYDRHVWISPALLLWQIATKQFLPLLIGMGLTAFLPAFSHRIRGMLMTIGNILLLTALVLLLAFMGPRLLRVSPWLPLAAAGLAVGCLLSTRLFLLKDPLIRHTLVVSNVNRHVGLAVLLAGQRLKNEQSLPAIACYAVAAQVLIFVYTTYTRKHPENALANSAAPDGSPPNT